MRIVNRFVLNDGCGEFVIESVKSFNFPMNTDLIEFEKGIYKGKFIITFVKIERIKSYPNEWELTYVDSQLIERLNRVVLIDIE